VAAFSNGASHGALTYSAFTSTSRVSGSRTPSGMIWGIRSWVCAAVHPLMRVRERSVACTKSTVRRPASYIFARRVRNAGCQWIEASPKSWFAGARSISAFRPPTWAVPARRSSARVRAASPAL
jgi:hypothetical protein